MRQIAIIVGHSHDSQGAVNAASGITEWQFNKGLAARVAEEMCQIPSFNPMIIYRSTYAALPRKVNITGCDMVISLHANAFNERTSGTEVLYAANDKSSMWIAKKLQPELFKALHLPDRGIKAIQRNDRGGFLLYKMTVPAVIVEPFFIDNDADLARATERKQELAKAITQGVVEYFS